MNDFVIQAGSEVPPAQLHAAFAAAFSDYLIGAFTLTLAQWPQFLGRQVVDLELSRVALRGEEIAAFAFIARRDDIGIRRLATMGAPPAWRGSGAAPYLLDDFVQRAQAAGCRAVELECFEQNDRALALYRGRGFEPVTPLYGYARGADQAPPQLDGEGGAAIAVEQAFAWLDDANRSRGDLPLQVTPRSLQANVAPLQARRRGSAVVVFSQPAGDVVTLNSLVDLQRTQADAQVLVAALLNEFAGKRFTVPQLQRPDVGGEALERLGFERLALNQVLMRRPL